MGARLSKTVSKPNLTSNPNLTRTVNPTRTTVPPTVQQTVQQTDAKKDHLLFLSHLDELSVKMPVNLPNQSMRRVSLIELLFY